MFVGQPLKRREDVKFLTGCGNYVDDVNFENLAYVGFVRSPHAHARIRRISVERAASLPGVLKVLTAADWAKAGFGKAEELYAKHVEYFYHKCLHVPPVWFSPPGNQDYRSLEATARTPMRFAVNAKELRYRDFVERGYVISGSLYTCGRRLAAGDFVHADAETEHGELWTEEGCRGILVVPPDDYLPPRSS